MLAAAAVTGALAAPAQAADCEHTATQSTVGCPTFPLTNAAFVSGVIGMIPVAMGILPFFALGANWDLRAAGRRRGAELYWYLTGCLAVALGGAAIGLEAFSPAPCGPGSDCRLSYGLGAARSAEEPCCWGSPSTSPPFRRVRSARGCCRLPC